MQKFMPVDWSVFSNDFSLNPYHYLKPLYSRSDVMGFQSEGLNFLFRYEDCREIIFSKNVNQEFAMSEPGLSASEANELYPNLMWYRQYNFVTAIDASKKVVIRRFLMSLQTGDSTKMWLNGCKRLMLPALEQLNTSNKVIDFMELFGIIPYQIITQTLGIEPNKEIETELHAAARAFIANWGRNDRQALLDSDRAIRTFRQHIDPLVERGSPLLKASTGGDELSTDEIRAILIFFLITSIDNIAITSAFMAINLLRDRYQLELLKRKPDLIDSAYMEFIRMDEHIKSVPRFVATSFEYKGVHFEKGEMINLFYPGANRDPNHWSNPNELDFSRDFTKGTHILFGAGRHACIGIEIANIFMPFILSGLVENLPLHAELIEDQIQINGQGLGERALEKVPIQV